MFNNFSSITVFYREHKVVRDETLDVFVYASSGVFKVTTKSATLGHELNRMVSNTTGIPTNLYKIFYKNQPLDLNSPVGKQLNPGCSVFLHILGKGGGGDGGNTSDLQGMSFPDTDSVDYTHKYYNTVFEVERARQT